MLSEALHVKTYYAVSIQILKKKQLLSEENFEENLYLLLIFTFIFEKVLSALKPLMVLQPSTILDSSTLP